MIQTIERKILQATETEHTHLSTRRQTLDQVKKDAQELSILLDQVPEHIENDKNILDLINTIDYAKTGMTDSSDLRWRLETIMEEWELARKGNEERRRVAEGLEKGQQQQNTGWWW